MGISEFINVDRIAKWASDADSGPELYALADRIRKECVGDEVFLRGLIEISNYCRRSCAYCGLNADRAVNRYRLTTDEILAAARQGQRFGYGTVVLQAGEDPALTRAWVSDLIKRIKEETGQAVTLSLGERDADDYETWRLAGADRYLLRFETSDPELFLRIHPPLLGSSMEDRIAILRRLKTLGYETGSGIMVGLPGQTWTSLAQDIALFHELDLDMIGIGPYLRHPDTALALEPERFPPAETGLQTTGDEETVCRIVALTRLTQPYANIPATTALSLINREDGRSHGLARGANIIMPNLTPERYRRLYDIYPSKSLLIESAETVNKQIAAQLAALGRKVGKGRGDSPNTLQEKD